MAAKETPKVKFEKREATGKGVCRKMRVNGSVPAVFYGPEYKESLVGSVGAKEISQIVNAPNWETTMIDLELPGGKTEMALLRGVQRNVITQNILHVDLYQLMRGHKVKVAVPIHVINKDICAGVKMGGILEQPLREVEINVLPREIPTEVILDMAKMAIGGEIFVRDLKMPESAELLTGEDTLVVMVARPRSMAAETAEEASDENVEVEVVGKGKASKESGEE